MEEIPIDIQISKMDILHAKELRKKLSKRISAIRVTDTIRLETVISAEKKYDMDIAIEWLYGNELIKKTRYSFLKFAVENTIKQVLREMKTEKDLQQQQSAMDSQEQPGS